MQAPPVAKRVDAVLTRHTVIPALYAAADKKRAMATIAQVSCAQYVFSPSLRTERSSSLVSGRMALR